VYSRLDMHLPHDILPIVGSSAVIRIMKRTAFLGTLLPPLLLALAGLACGLTNPLENPEAVSTAAALVPTLKAAAVDLAPTLEAMVTDLAPAVEAAATALMIATPEEVPMELATTVQPAASPTPELPRPTPIGGIEEYLGVTDASTGLSGLASFRQTAALSFIGNGETGKVDYWGEFTAAPQATHGRVVLSGLAAAGLPIPTFEYIIIESAAWIKIGRQPWIPIVEEIETLTGRQPFSADDFFLGVPAAQRVLPNQIVGGVECKHYIYDVNDLQIEGGRLSSASGEIYTALDGGYVVLYTLHGLGSLDEFFAGQSGTIDLSYTVSDVNSGITIRPPR